MTLTPRSAGLQIAVIKVSDWAVCEITTSINVDTGRGTCLCHRGHLRWPLKSQEQSQEQCMSNEKWMIITLVVRAQEKCDRPLWGTLSPSPSDRPAELEFPVTEEEKSTLIYIHNIVWDIQSNKSELTWELLLYWHLQDGMKEMKCHYYNLVNVLLHIFQIHLKNECEYHQDAHFFAVSYIFLNK